MGNCKSAPTSKKTLSSLKINKRPKDDASDDEKEESNLNLLHGKGTACNSKHATTNIIARCDHLQRLTFALKRYESGLSDSEWDALLSAHALRLCAFAE